jgi:hypothetical protein
LVVKVGDSCTRGLGKESASQLLVEEEEEEEEEGQGSRVLTSLVSTCSL